MCLLCRLAVAKNHNFGQILNFLGILYWPPFTDEGHIWCYSIPTVHAYLINFVSIGLFCRPVAAENPNFCRFFGLRHLVVSPIGSSLRKFNTGTQLQTFPYPMVSKSFLYSHAFMAKSGAQSLTFKSVMNRQTKNSTFLAAPAAGEIQAPPNLAWW